ncbi:MAG: peptidase M48 [Gallionellales bacterium RBG_16_56_9]|nr:MAG: peptidase M48 [Gallionellales bacterium RBG_16_56_9]
MRQTGQTNSTTFRSRLAAGCGALLCAPLLAACTTPTPETSASTPGAASVPAAVDSAQQNDLRALVALQDRLYNVAAPLLVKNAALCQNNARKLFGFTAKTRYSYSGEFVAAAQSVLGLEDRLKVTGLLPDSGAARAGVRRGDILLAVDGQPMPQGENAEREAATLLGPIVASRSSVNLTLLRNGSNLTLNVPLTLACAFGVELGNSDNVISYADGRRVLVTRGMMAFTQSDRELAYLLAKEMAHNALAHAHRLKMSATISGIIDNLILLHPDMSMMGGSAGIKTYSADQDASAQALALYMAARAGYGIDQAASFWNRLALRYPPSVPNGYTAIHPSTASQIALVEKTVAEIKAKQAARKPLMP